MIPIEAWSRKHPQFGPNTIRMFLSDGFVVQPLDGNEANPDPHNMVITHASDVPDFNRYAAARQIYRGPVAIVTGPSVARKVRPAAVSKKSYDLLAGGMSWSETYKSIYAKELDEKSRVRLVNAVKSYAKHHKLPWPIKPAAPAPDALDSPRTQDDVEPMRVAIP